MLLTPAEKDMAREVCVAFGQAVRLYVLFRWKDDILLLFLRAKEPGKLWYRYAGLIFFVHKEGPTSAMSMDGAL